MLALCAVLASAPVHAGPPFETDDPEPPPPGHFELLIAAEYAKTAEGRSGSLPLVELNYGLLPDMQIGVHVPYAFNDPHGPSSGGDGPGDVELGLKYRFIHEDGWIPAVCVFPSYRSGSGDAKHGLGEDGQGFELPFWLARSLEDGGALYAGGGYRRQWTSSHLEHTWFEAALATMPFGERLTLGAEVFSETSALPHEAAATGFDVGGLYEFSGRIHLLGSAGKGISQVRRSNELSVFLGVQIAY